jgi:predicted amidophosphoribosyltransferase
MLGCLSCGALGRSPLCRACSNDLAPGPGAWLEPGLRVAAGLTHVGSARRLVHRLKYDGAVEAAWVLARFVVPLVPQTAAALVPVPRATVRRLRYGIDPARELASALAGFTGLPVVDALIPGLWWRQRAGSVIRASPRLAARTAVPDGIVLVDDVITTGSTMRAAFAALGSVGALGVAATAPVRLGPQTSRRRRGAGEVA